jgi:hypothetical protein
MPLNARQIRCYTHLCNVWRLSQGSVNPATKVKADGVWSLVASGIPCLYVYTDNVSDPLPGGGRVKRPSLFTDDHIKFAIDQDIREGDIVVNVSLQPNGAHVDSVYGECSRLLGQPKSVPSSGARRANFRAFLMMTEEKPPLGVTP